MHGHTALHSHTCVDNCKNVAVPKLPPLLCSALMVGGGQYKSLCSTSSPLHPGCFYGQLRLLFHLKRFSPTLPRSSQVRVRGCPCSSFHQKERDSQPTNLSCGGIKLPHTKPLSPSFHSGTHVCTLCGARVRFRVHLV